MPTCFASAQVLSVSVNMSEYVYEYAIESSAVCVCVLRVWVCAGRVWSPSAVIKCVVFFCSLVDWGVLVCCCCCCCFWFPTNSRLLEADVMVECYLYTYCKLKLSNRRFEQPPFVCDKSVCDNSAIELESTHACCWYACLATHLRNGDNVGERVNEQLEHATTRTMVNHRCDRVRIEIVLKSSTSIYYNNNHTRLFIIRCSFVFVLQWNQLQYICK